MAEETERVIEDAPTSQELLEAALEYARQGWPVFPVHTPVGGVCDCLSGSECASPGKHPWTRNGLLDATTDELTIRRWWKERPLANIGLPVREGYAIVDVDGPHGAQRLADEQKHLMTTAVQTSGRGAHYVYRTRNRVHPRSLIPQSAEGAHDGVDLRGPGSYVVAAPSLHASGRVYTWSVPLSQVEIAPDWLEEVALETGGTTVGARERVDFVKVLAGLPEGQRKWEIYRAASKLRAADVPLDFAVMLAVQAAEHCTPPLASSEAERKVREAYRDYPPNAQPGDLPAGVTPLSTDSVMVEFESCRFVFSDMEKSGRELHAEMEVKNLLPGLPQEPYIQRLNLLSMSARESCRRELDHVLGTSSKGHWTTHLSRAITKAQHAFLNMDRSEDSAEIEGPPTLKFVIPDLVVEDGLSILFGAGSAGKTFLLMRAALAVSRGEPFLDKPTARRKVLYIDCETGRSTYAYRLRRLCAGEGLEVGGARGIRYWWAGGIPLEDQVDAIKRCCQEHEIGFLCLDHIAAACGGDAAEQVVASRFARAVSKIGLPMLALAHITGAAANDPEAAQRPFGSIFWENSARRTVFVLRQQEDDSEIADLGLYPRKINDGGRNAAEAARITFDDPSGPIMIEAQSWGSNGLLTRARGASHVLWDALGMPLTAEDLADRLGLSLRNVKRTLADHPRLFVTLDPDVLGGRGREKRWARKALDLP